MPARITAVGSYLVLSIDMTVTKEIKASLDKKKLVVGTRDIVRHMKKGEVHKIFHATNIPNIMLRDLEYYTSLSKTELSEFGESSARLGQICGKPFRILAVGIKK